MVSTWGYGEIGITKGFGPLVSRSYWDVPTKLYKQMIHLFIHTLISHYTFLITTIIALYSR
jgi:hypothetical protein